MTDDRPIFSTAKCGLNSDVLTSNFDRPILIVQSSLLHNVDAILTAQSEFSQSGEVSQNSIQTVEKMGMIICQNFLRRQNDALLLPLSLNLVSNSYLENGKEFWDWDCGNQNPVVGFGRNSFEIQYLHFVQFFQNLKNLAHKIPMNRDLNPMKFYIMPNIA